MTLRHDPHTGQPISPGATLRSRRGRYRPRRVPRAARLPVQADDQVTVVAVVRDG
jgi:hypothetical protein